jgi:hypothetical protein
MVWVGLTTLVCSGAPVGGAEAADTGVLVISIVRVLAIDLVVSGTTVGIGCPSLNVSPSIVDPGGCVAKARVTSGLRVLQLLIVLTGVNVDAGLGVLAWGSRVAILAVLGGATVLTGRTVSTGSSERSTGRVDSTTTVGAGTTVASAYVVATGTVVSRGGIV